MNINLNNVTKYYFNDGKSTKGIENVSLNFDTNSSFVVITGESGSGKTTLIKILTGLEDFDDGDIFFDGIPLSGMTTNQRLNIYQQNISFVFQDYNLVESLSPKENIIIALLKQGISKQKALKISNNVLNQVGLTKKRYPIISKLSGGERQRVAIARSIAINTPVIIFDEPTGNLDQETSAKIIELIKVVGNGKLIVFVTHEYDYVKDMATRHIVLSDGHIIKDEIIKENINNKTINAPQEIKKNKNTGKLSFSAYLYESFLFCFRKFWRFIATFLILLLTSVSIFASSFSYTSLLTNFAKSVDTSAVSSMYGNQVSVLKKYDENIALPKNVNFYKDAGSLFDDQYLYLFDEGIAKTIKTTLNASTLTYGIYFRPLPCLTKDVVFENSDVKELSGTIPVSLIYTRSSNSYINANEIRKAYVGKKYSLVNANNLQYINTPSTIAQGLDYIFSAIPEVTIVNVTTCKNESISDSSIGIYGGEAFNNALSKLLKAELNAFSSFYSFSQMSRYSNFTPSFTTNIVNSELSIISSSNKTYTNSFEARNFGYNLNKINDYPIVLPQELKDDANAYLQIYEKHIPISYLKSVYDIDFIETEYNEFFIDSCCISKILSDTELFSSYYFESSNDAKNYQQELSSKNIDATYYPISNIYYDFNSIDLSFKILLCIILLFFIFFVYFVSNLLRRILSKFYYRKDQDQNVLTFIGYSNKDMFIINLIQFLSLSIFITTLVYVIGILCSAEIYNAFILFPWVMILSIFIIIIFAFLISLPGKQRERRIKND